MIPPPVTLYRPRDASHYRFNLWLYGDSAPAGGEPVEVVITDFSFWETGANGSPEGESPLDSVLDDIAEDVAGAWMAD